MVCFIGAYTVAGRSFDLWLALVFGLVGYLFKKLDYPIAPLVLAMVLGDTASGHSRRALVSVKPADPLPELPQLDDMWGTHLDPDDEPREPRHAARDLASRSG